MEEKENNIQNEESKKFNRRDFLKIAGVTTAIGAAAGAINLTTPGVAMADYMAPAQAGVKGAIKYLNAPPYDLPPYADGSKLPRFNQEMHAYNNVDFAKQYCEGQFWITYMDGTIKPQVWKSGKPGFSVRDYAFEKATMFDMYNPQNLDWGTNYEPLLTNKVGKWEDTPENNSKTIKKFATFCNPCAVGITEMKENWWYSRSKTHQDLIISDEYTKPEKLEKEWHIPKAMNRVIVIAYPMDGSFLAKYANTAFAQSAVYLGYSEMNESIGKIATFIREMGYNAIPCNNEIALSVPMAAAAGLGEIGRHGLLINPEYGSMLRLAKVVTDMPLAIDKPISFGAVNFCKTCKKCAIYCPSKSVPMDDEPSYDNIVCPGNNPGAKRWITNSWTCLQYWIKKSECCAHCIAVCPYSKPDSWIHSVVKTISSKTTAFNSIFFKMDEAFGFGAEMKDYTQADIDAWWNDPKDRMYNWKYES
ncbi:MULTISPECIES: reductive dehalogenase [unclassified Dehalobacter]|uniref:reductive dehalogenase n=1 Tax=unclassified Dehalobacter TaxID=2635733 RepID=UPI000E6C01A4|nr:MULTISPECIES: reductive dehalogenase [unclassified Dehalobacter]RJE48663.1 hypothetical protein A7K50_10045 [Dehalobacter sp. MCB1]TCX53421.1 reductive dehalogenase [Dehalobacter sp. 14DCB1]TCX54436.1 reductive dehalogenase [Dehalobacter sp. 12DCB1]